MILIVYEEKFIIFIQTKLWIITSTEYFHQEREKNYLGMTLFWILSIF